MSDFGLINFTENVIGILLLALQLNLGCLQSKEEEVVHEEGCVVGDKINKGDIIGTVGSTGRSTGPHLDFRVNWFQTRLDPMSVIN